MATKPSPKQRPKKKKGAAPKHWPWRTYALYGISGIGKTTLSATSPKPYFLDSNQGLLSIDNRPGYEHVRSRPVHHISDLERAFDRFMGTRRPVLRGRFETIIFDHFDDIQSIVMNELTEKAAAKDDRRSLDEYTVREWGIMANRLKRLIRKWKSVPAHKILIFSQGMDKVTGQLQPAVMGNVLQQALPYLCDYIFYMRISKKDGSRYIFLDQRDSYLAKCRAWWIKERRIRVPDPDKDPKFLTTLFERLAAGPTRDSTTFRGNIGGK